VTLAWIDDHRPGPTRVAFAMSRKVGPAVVRNRLRRQLRELARRSAGTGTLPPGVLLVSVTPAAATSTFVTLGRCWDDAVSGLAGRS